MYRAIDFWNSKFARKCTWNYSWRQRLRLSVLKSFFFSLSLRSLETHSLYALRNVSLPRPFIRANKQKKGWTRGCNFTVVFVRYIYAKRPTTATIIFTGTCDELRREKSNTLVRDLFEGSIHHRSTMHQVLKFRCRNYKIKKKNYSKYCYLLLIFYPRLLFQSIPKFSLASMLVRISFWHETRKRCLQMEKCTEMQAVFYRTGINRFVYPTTMGCCHP